MSCMDCKKRFVGCHSRCPEYLERWERDRERDRKKVAEYQADSINFDAVEKTRGRKVGQRKW